MFARVTPIAREALARLFTDRKLWIFGLFAGAGGGASVNLPQGDVAAVPAWLVPLGVVAAVVGLVVLALHVVSEGALIAAVHEERGGGRLGFGDAARRGAKTAWRVFGVKLGVTALAGVATLLIVAPVGLGLAEQLPLALGVVGTVLLAIVLVPVVVTLWLVHQFAMRMVVLERRRVIDALRAAGRFLRGRLRYGVGLLLVSGAAQVVSALVVAPFALLAVGLGFAGYALGGLPLGIALGGLVGFPVALIVTGARETFRSRLWTVAFLEERPSLG